MKVESTTDFSFESYRVIEYSYSNPSENVSNIFVDFSPSGLYHSDAGLFALLLELNIFYTLDNKDVKFMSILLEASFNFVNKPSFDKIPEYFYQNSVAIVFPYLRSFTTTLTSISNVRPVILPLMNLTSLAPVLKENSSVFSEQNK